MLGQSTLFQIKSDLLHRDRIIFVYLETFSSKTDDKLVDAVVKISISRYPRPRYLQPGH